MRLFMKKWSTFYTTHRINHTAAPLTAGGLAIHGSGIPNRTTLCSAPALKSPWLLANFHFGSFSARESCRSHSSQLRSRAKVIPLHLEGETTRKSTILSAQLWVWHLPDGWGPFLASHKAQMCQAPRLTPTDGQQGLEELCTAPSVGWRRMLSQ